MGYTLHKENGRWHVFFIDQKGKRVRKTTKQSDKRKAIAFADDLYRRHADPTYQAANEATIGSASTALLEHLNNRGRALDTIEFYRKKLGHLYRVLDKDRSLATVDARLVDEYIALRRKEGATSHTISKELTAMRMLLKVARRRGEFGLEVSQVMPIGFATKYKPRERVLTREEVWHLIADLPPGPSTYVAFVAATTARDAAVGRALGKHFADGFIKVYDFKTKRALRQVPLTRLTEMFALYAFSEVKPNEHVAPNCSAVRNALSRSCKRLGMDPVSPNDIRRSVAHWLRAEEVPLEVIAGVFGHADTRMLEKVYGKLDPRELSKLLGRILD